MTFWNQVKIRALHWPSRKALLKSLAKRSMVTKPVYSNLFLSRDQKEILLSWDWFKERRPERSNRFVKEVFRSVYNIDQRLESFVNKFKLYREKIINSFLSLIIYGINKRKRTSRIDRLVVPYSS